MDQEGVLLCDFDERKSSFPELMGHVGGVLLIETGLLDGWMLLVSAVSTV
jgi:hypothetical protein